jgi:hypothetical protein
MLQKRYQSLIFTRLKANNPRIPGRGTEGQAGAHPPFQHPLADVIVAAFRSWGGNDLTS